MYVNKKHIFLYERILFTKKIVDHTMVSTIWILINGARVPSEANPEVAKIGNKTILIIRN